MSMFRRLFGSRAEPPPTPSSFDQGQIAHTLPLKLRIGARISFDRTMYQVAPGAMTVELPEGHQGVPCYGHIDLGDGYAEHRFYTEDDAFLQVATCAGEVETVRAFVIHEIVNPPTQQQFQAFITGHAHLGDPVIDYAGRQWTRATNSTDETARIPAIAYDETLYRHSPPRRDGDLTHYAMFYRREVPELQRDELLIVSGEDSGPGEFCVSYSIGLELNEADFEIT